MLLVHFLTAAIDTRDEETTATSQQHFPIYTSLKPLLT